MPDPWWRGTVYEDSEEPLEDMALDALIALALRTGGSIMPLTTRCKFKCEAVKPVQVDQATTGEGITLRANYDPADETNKVWSKYTPSGEFHMTVTNPAVVGRFVVGKFYFLDITEAE